MLELIRRQFVKHLLFEKGWENFQRIFPKKYFGIMKNLLELVHLYFYSFFFGLAKQSLKLAF